MERARVVLDEHQRHDDAVDERQLRERVRHPLVASQQPHRPARTLEDRADGRVHLAGYVVA